MTKKIKKEEIISKLDFDVSIINAQLNLIKEYFKGNVKYMTIETNKIKDSSLGINVVQFEVKFTLVDRDYNKYSQTKDEPIKE